MEHNSLLGKIAELANTNVRSCIQCGRCSAACPVADKMDLVPSRMVWALMQGDEEALLNAQAPWKCLSCMSCVSRCPKGVSAGAINEAVRLVQLRQQGGDRLTIEELQHYPADMPQQALVAALRKYRK